MSKTTQRTIEQIREQYEIEKELAYILRTANSSERRELYTSLYDEFYRRLPHHTQLRRKQSPELTKKHVDRQFRLLRKFLRNDISFLEVGPGDCSLSLQVAQQVKQVYAIDISNEITKKITLPPNLRLIISDGSSTPVPNQSVDLAYSHQLMEHLHPEDADSQLKNIYNALADN